MVRKVFTTVMNLSIKIQNHNVLECEGNEWCEC